MFSTPLICCSSGATTVEATTSALAPGYWPGDVDDRRRDLRILRDRQPRERHAAEDHEHDRDDGGEDRPIDEEMRNAHRPAGPSVGLGARRARRCGVACRLLRASPLPRAHPHQAVDDDAVVGRQAFPDHAQIVDHLSERHVLLPGDVIVVDHVARTCAPARCRWRRRAPAAPRYGAEPGTWMRPNMPGVNRPSALANCARPRMVPDERSMALSTKSILPVVREILLVDQLQPHRRVAAAGRVRRCAAAPAARSADSEASSKVNSKRIGSIDTMVASSVVLPPVPPVTRLPGETRRSPMRPVTGALQLGELEIELGLAHRRLLRCDRGLGVRAACVRCSKVCSLMVRSRSSCWPRARSASAKARLDLRLGQVRARLVERGLERPLIDGEQEVALLDDLAVLEMHLVEVARHARAHLDRIDRDEAADIFVLVDDRALGRLGHRHRRRWRRRRLLRLAAAREQPGRGNQNGSRQDWGGDRHEARRQVSRFRRSYPFAARAPTNIGTKGH